jgi:hypothetical protein
MQCQARLENCQNAGVYSCHRCWRYFCKTHRDRYRYHPTGCLEEKFDCLEEKPKSYKLEFHATFVLLGIIVGAIGLALQSKQVIAIGAIIAAPSIIGGMNALHLQAWPIGSRHRKL